MGEIYALTDHCETVHSAFCKSVNSDFARVYIFTIAKVNTVFFAKSSHCDNWKRYNSKTVQTCIARVFTVTLVNFNPHSGTCKRYYMYNETIARKSKHYITRVFTMAIARVYKGVGRLEKVLRRDKSKNFKALHCKSVHNDLLRVYTVTTAKVYMQ